MVVFSKYQSITCTCREYVHPWTQSCTAATAGLGINASKESFKLYLVFYVLALLMKGRIPSIQDINGLILRVVQSTAFLTCHAFSYSMILCIIRRIFGSFNIMTASYVPAFVASYLSILVERPSRRGLLSLYVTNVASETLFRMAAWRGLVRPIQYGDWVIFSLAVTGLLYLYKSKSHNKDPIFSLLRFIVGPWEEKNRRQFGHQPNNENEERSSCEKSGAFTNTTNYYCSILFTLINKIKTLRRNVACPHPFSCVYYALQGSAKMFSVGYSLQVCLRLILQMKRILRNPKQISKCLLHRNAFYFGAFLGGFSGIFRTVSCVLRWVSSCDSEYHAIPAGILASMAIGFFPDITIALYLLWKLVEIMYSNGVEKGYFPRLPGATILLYCASTAVLFHAALLEPHNLRPSYWKFLHRISGGWIVTMDRQPLDAFGLGSSSSLAKVLKETGTNYLLYPHFG